jgi:hypothetical protein
MPERGSLSRREAGTLGSIMVWRISLYETPWTCLGVEGAE